MQYLVSVIMPAYNAEKYIAQSIQSVLDQTYQNWELLVVNDGSTDKTARIVHDYLVLDNRIKYIFQQNKGLGNARNTGIENSSGELIAFLDSDDLWLKEKLDLQIKIMRQTGADLIFTDGYVFFEDRATDEAAAFGTINGKFTGSEIFSLLFMQNRIPVLSVLTRKVTINEVGLFDENPRCHGSEDYDLWLRMAKHGAVFYGMKEILVRYRVHAQGMSRNEIAMLKAWSTVLRKHRQDKSLDRNIKEIRFKELDSQIASILISEGRFTEAIKYLGELPMRDKSAFLKLLLGLQSKLYRRNAENFLRKCYNSGTYRGKQLLRVIRVISR